MIKRSVRNLRNLLSVPVLAAFVAFGTMGCEDTPGELESKKLQWEMDHARHTEVTVKIMGEGFVSADSAGSAGSTTCAQTNSSDTKTCDPFVFGSNGGVITASPAFGWYLAAWTSDDVRIESRDSLGKILADQVIMGGSVGTITVVFMPMEETASPYKDKIGGDPNTKVPTFSASPIKAVFYPEQQMTMYGLEIFNPNNEAVTIAWTGPNCGKHSPEVPETGTIKGMRAMTWQHPHPECDNTTAHASVRVGLVIAGPSGVLICHYNGAESGTGPMCEH